MNDSQEVANAINKTRICNIENPSKYYKYFFSASLLLPVRLAEKIFFRMCNEIEPYKITEEESSEHQIQVVQEAIEI